MVQPKALFSQELEWMTVRNFKPVVTSALISSRPDGFISSCGSGSAISRGGYSTMGPPRYPDADPNPDCDATNLFLNVSEQEDKSATAFQRFEHMIDVATGKASPSSNAIGASTSALYLVKNGSDQKAITDS